MANNSKELLAACMMKRSSHYRQASQQSVEDGERRLQIIETEREALKLQVTKLKAVAEEKRQVGYSTFL